MIRDRQEIWDPEIEWLSYFFLLCPYRLKLCVRPNGLFLDQLHIAEINALNSNIKLWSVHRMAMSISVCNAI
jgi:hypothetical protein